VEGKGGDAVKGKGGNEGTITMEVERRGGKAGRDLPDQCHTAR